MSIDLGQLLAGQADQLRSAPTTKRVRAVIDGRTVLDSRRAALVWAPGDVVPTYAVPLADITAPLAPTAPSRQGAVSGSTVTVGDGDHPGTAVIPEDSDLADLAILDFPTFERWLEEDEEIRGHPRDPFHRVDVRATSRRIQVRLGDQILADTRRGKLVFETSLQTRSYIPPEDVLVPLTPTTTHTICPYKGDASYWAFEADGNAVEDLVWSYESPLEDAAALAGYRAFYDEHLDVRLDPPLDPDPVGSSGSPING